MTAPRPSTVSCDVGASPPDMATIDALARLQLEARRRGTAILLRNASRELRELFALVGLSDVLRVEAGGKPE